MMVEFLPNLDDGELWIPSDILVADVPTPAASKTAFPPPSPPSFHSRSSRDLSADVDLARHFAALSLLNRPSQGQLQRFGFANQYALTASPTPNGPPPTYPSALRSGSPYSSPDPVLHYHLVQPGQGHAGARLQPRQTRCLFQNAVSRPLQPGFARDCSGTGVFLPRAANDGVRRKQGAGNRSMRVENAGIGQGRNPAEEWWCHHGHGSVRRPN